MLSYLHSCCRNHHSRSRGNVKAMCTIPSCTDNLKHVTVMFNLACMLSHSCRTAGYLIYCLCLGALCRQSRKKCCILSLCSLTAHNLIHYLICLVISQIAFFHNLYNSFLNHIESSLSIIINYVTANLKFPAKQL